MPHYRNAHIFLPFPAKHIAHIAAARELLAKLRLRQRSDMHIGRQAALPAGQDDARPLALCSASFHARSRRGFSTSRPLLICAGEVIMFIPNSASFTTCRHGHFRPAHTRRRKSFPIDAHDTTHADPAWCCLIINTRAYFFSYVSLNIARYSRHATFDAFILYLLLGARWPADGHSDGATSADMDEFRLSSARYDFGFLSSPPFTLAIIPQFRRH